MGFSLRARARAAVRLYVSQVDSAWRSCAALQALLKIQMAAGTAKAVLQRGAIQLVEIGCRRIQHQVLRLAVGVVAARMGQGLEQADLVGAAHEAILCRWWRRRIQVLQMIRR